MADGLGIDLESVAPFVPVDDRFLVGVRDRQVAVVLVLDTGAQGARDGRRGSEVLVGGAHADVDVVSSVQRNLPVPLRRVRADPAVDGVEVVLATWRLGRGLGDAEGEAAPDRVDPMAPASAAVPALLRNVRRLSFLRCDMISSRAGRS